VPVEFSSKQLEYFATSNSFINLAEGAVRSGKTHVNLYRFAEHALSGPPGDMMVLGKTERTVKRNVVSPLKQISRGEDFSVRYVQGSGELWIGPRLVHVVGANDVSSEEKVQGVTLAGSYCNELTLYPEGVWQTLLDRHSVDGAQIFADCNPDSPYHWLYRDYMQGEAIEPSDLLSLHFELNDNPSLSQVYKDRLSRIHPPGTLWHKRMVLGLWVVAEGAIYDQFDADHHVVSELPDPSEFTRYLVGVDYGTANATVFLLLGKGPRAWYVISEWRHDARKSGRQMTDAEYSAAFIHWMRSHGVTPSSIEVDPSAASFKLQLRRDGVRRVFDAKNEVIDGIRLVSSALSNDRLFIHESCKELIAEMANYRWDEKAVERGEEAPVKKADHGPDALRYGCHRAFGKQTQRALRAL
jgi:PBSX family phage terminase large subunit